MSIPSYRRPAALVLLIGLAAVAVGCKGDPASSNTTGTAASGATASTAAATAADTAPKSSDLTVELSGASVTRTSERVLHCEVKYRFTGGGPKPTAWYVFAVKYQNGGGALRQCWGKELKAEEVVNKDLTLLREWAGGKVEIAVYEAPHPRGASRKVSNVISIAP